MGEIIKIEFASNDDLSPVTTMDYSQAVNREDGSRAINTILSQTVLKRIKFPTPYNSDTDVLELQVSRDRVNWDNLLSFVGVISIEGTTGLTNSYWEFYDAAHNNRITAGIGLTKYIDEDFIAMRYGQYRAIGGNQQLSDWSDIVNPWYWRVAKKTFANCEDVVDYNSLLNKPKINGVELVGDRSLNDLGLDISNYYTKSEVNTALNNKVSMPIRLGTYVDLNEIVTPGMYYRPSGSKTGVLNSPYGTSGNLYFSLFVELSGRSGGSVIQTITRYDNSSQHRRAGYYNSSGDLFTWTDWTRIATVKTPTVNELPLRSGFSAGNSGAGLNTYTKNDSGLVVIHFCIARTDSAIFANDSYIADIPTGFRPLTGCSFCAVGASVIGSTDSSAYADSSARVYIGNDGTIKARHRNLNIRQIDGTMIYYAAQ